MSGCSGHKRWWLREFLRAWALRDRREVAVKHAEGFKRMALWRGDS